MVNINKCQQLGSLSEEYTGVHCTIFSTVDLKIFKQKENKKYTSNVLKI